MEVRIFDSQGLKIVLNVSPHGNPHRDHSVAQDWRLCRCAVRGLRIPFDHDDERSTDRLSIPSP